MGTKFALASLAPLIIQLLYLLKFFVISYQCMPKVGNNKIFYLPRIPRKYLLLLQKDLICTKRILATEHLAWMQMNQFLVSTENVQACYEKLFYSVAIQFLTQFFGFFISLPVQSTKDMCTSNYSLLLIAQSQVDFVILSQSINLQLCILLTQWTAVVLSESIFI